MRIQRTYKMGVPNYIYIIRTIKNFARTIILNVQEKYNIDPQKPIPTKL